MSAESKISPLKATRHRKRRANKANRPKLSQVCRLILSLILTKIIPNLFQLLDQAVKFNCHLLVQPPTGVGVQTTDYKQFRRRIFNHRRHIHDWNIVLPEKIDYLTGYRAALLDGCQGWKD